MAEPGRNPLVEQHLPLVHAVARKLNATMRGGIDLDDLVAYGSKGLVEAAERFDGRAGVAFSTFAYYRIRGAMIDGMRTMGWYRRADTERFRAEERAHEYMRTRSEGEGAAHEAAGAGGEPDVGETLESIAGALGGIAAIHIASIEAAGDLADERQPPPDERLAGARQAKRVREAVKSLPERERRLMEAYYFSDKTLEAAGAQLGLSKSWASRLHARAVDLLRDALAEA